MNITQYENTKLKDQIEKIEWTQKREISELKEKYEAALSLQQDQYESKLNDIKYLNEQEQISLRSKIRKLEDELALLSDAPLQPDFSLFEEYEKDKVKVINIRLSEINNKISEDVVSREKENVSLKKENDDLKNKNRSIRSENERLKAELKSKIVEKDVEYSQLRQKYKEKCSEVQETDASIKEILKLKKKISDLKYKFSKLEEERREIKECLKERENELEVERASKKKAIIAEKRKAKVHGDKIVQMKREIELKKNEIESLRKDQIDQNEREDSRYYSPKVYRKIRANDQDGTISDKKTNYTLKGTQAYITNKNKFDPNQTLSKVDTNLLASKKNSKRLKSSSPTRNNILGSSKKILITQLDRKRSANRLPSPSEEPSFKVYNHMHNHGTNKYCEACKYKAWRINQLNYNPEQLMANRDIIRMIICLGCDRSFEVKDFIKHCRDCRLSNQIPHIDGTRYWKNSNKSDNKSSFEDKYGECKSSENNDDLLIPPRKSSRNQSRNKIKSDQIEVPSMLNVKSNPALHKAYRKYSSGKEDFDKQISEDPIEHSEDSDEDSVKEENDSVLINQSVLDQSNSKPYNFEETSENINESSVISGAQGKKISEQYKCKAKAFKRLKEKQSNEFNTDSDSEMLYLFIFLKI